MMSRLAFFRLPDGRAWLGLGPFESLKVRPSEPAFYVNDFSLSDPAPWKRPAKCLPLAAGESLPAALPLSSWIEGEAPKVQWSKPQTEWFKMVFRRIRREVQGGRLQKMVPALPECGHLQVGHPLALLPRLMQGAAGAWAYAWAGQEDGFLGLTPELLLGMQGRQLSTMALAGTAKPGAREAFATDAKEIEEHELVVGSLMEQLQPLGRTHRAARALCQAGSLLHFQSTIDVELAQAPDAGALISLLHPTPAVGCLPRTAPWLQKLRQFREQLQVPPFFGAPFGFSEGGLDQAIHVVVAIRGLGWLGTEVSLPSGCGIVSGSAFDHEWRELRLKREAVLRQLGLDEAGGGFSAGGDLVAALPAGAA